MLGQGRAGRQGAGRGQVCPNPAAGGPPALGWQAAAAVAGCSGWGRERAGAGLGSTADNRSYVCLSTGRGGGKLILSRCVFLVRAAPGERAARGGGGCPPGVLSRRAACEDSASLQPKGGRESNVVRLRDVGHHATHRPAPVASGADRFALIHLGPEPGGTSKRDDVRDEPTLHAAPRNMVELDHVRIHQTTVNARRPAEDVGPEPENG